MTVMLDYPGPNSCVVVVVCARRVVYIPSGFIQYIKVLSFHEYWICLVIDKSNTVHTSDTTVAELNLKSGCLSKLLIDQ